MMTSIVHDFPGHTGTGPRSCDLAQEIVYPVRVFHVAEVFADTAGRGIGEPGLEEPRR